MSLNFHIEVDGLPQTVAAFKRVERGVVDMRQLGTWKWVASEFYKILKEAFSSEGSSGKSGKWAPLKPAYAAVKSKKYGNMPILQASGKLYKSLTSAGADGAVFEETANELTIGSSIPYGGYHQRGTSRMPAREPISLTESQTQRLLDPIRKKLEQLIDNAKLRDLKRR